LGGGELCVSTSLPRLQQYHGFHSTRRKCFFHVKVKVKANPVTGRGGAQDCENAADAILSRLSADGLR
jgi:hypothetical protein